jgi:hypothetical protein
MAKERTVPLGVDIPEVLHKKLRARRDTTGLTIKRIVADALREALDKPYCIDGQQRSA